MKVNWGLEGIQSLNLAKTFPASHTLLASSSFPTHFLQMVEKMDTYSF